MSTAGAWALVFLVLAVTFLIWGMWWRGEAEDLNEANLNLHQKLDELERQAHPKPRIQFGPQIAAKSVLPDGLLFTEGQGQPVEPELPNGVRRLRTIPTQRGGEQS